MNAMNPPWDPRFGAGFGGGFRGGHRAAFRAAMAAEHGAGRGGPHEHPDEDDGGRRGGPGRRGRRHSGPRFGPPGAPFGPGGFGPGGPGFGPGPRGFGRRGRRTNRGDVRAAVLALVAEQPRHGYEIIQEIAARTDGAWKPSPGSVYPTLSQLEDEGLVRVEQTDGRRVVQLTDAGTTYVAEHREELDKVWESAVRDPDDDTAELWTQLGQLHAAAQQVMATGTPEQMHTATEAITEARKAIYRLLAE
ncbi:PadR family transcriptional regulator [Pseudonocardia benzenivorans]|jgi:DNA-binding PadR family transcriptional regulator|uniref:Transcriptional regulator, PadR-like family n=3 Tax=Pseudonocardia TaxID=1847 RepID=F4CN56_PSEUX|nr:PadR family transcriptional regulator [Pseudonocardia dioxanivorans]AEA26069.1 transcriptional regulator, PadR-like family [Pseudonocardia dioxanivorans CB1190]